MVTTRTRFAAAIVSTAILAACTTLSLDDTRHLANKVWRMEVVDASAKIPMTDADPARGYSENYPKAMRCVRAYMATPGFLNGTQRIIHALLPDHVPDLYRGDIVEVYYQNPPQVTYTGYRLHRLVRLVCRATDKPCIRHERETIGTVVGNEFAMDRYAQRGSGSP